MARHVGGYFDEWQATLEDPEKLGRFVSFVNAPDTPDPSISFTEERGQIRPGGSGRAGAARRRPSPSVLRSTTVLEHRRRVR